MVILPFTTSLHSASIPMLRKVGISPSDPGIQACQAAGIVHSVQKLDNSRMSVHCTMYMLLHTYVLFLSAEFHFLVSLKQKLINNIDSYYVNACKCVLG